MEQNESTVPVMFQRELKELQEEQRDPAAHDVILYTRDEGMCRVFIRDDPAVIESIAGMVHILGFPHMTMAKRDVPYELAPVFRSLTV